jgi:hypothetical protein
LLNRGYKIAAGSGRDWHREEDEETLSPATWLGIRDGLVSAESVREALAAGRTFVSCGPAMELSLRDGAGVYGLGETVRAGEYALSLVVDESRRRRVWERFNIKTQTLRLVHNGGIVKTISCNGSHEEESRLALSPGWLRAEGYGSYLDEADKLLFFSSPVYIEPVAKLG